MRPIRYYKWAADRIGGPTIAKLPLLSRCLSRFHDARQSECEVKLDTPARRLLGSAAMLIAVDGHDCSGKTTLCRGLVTRLGGIYCRPFDRATSIDMVTAWRENRIPDVIRAAETAIARFLKTYDDLPTPVVCDRWILSARALIGDEWIPPTQPRAMHIVCDVDAPTYRKRQHAREAEIDECAEPQIRRYRALAAATGVLRLDSCALDAEAMLSTAVDTYLAQQGCGS